MDANCFGDVVDDNMLDTMVKYSGHPKTQEDRAREAMRLMTDGDKKNQARRYVENLKGLYGNGSSTLCLVYNASGDSLRYAANYDWYNSGVYRGPGYPLEIGNGQWAAFLHVHNQGAATGSEGAIVYRGKNIDGQERDFLLAWCTPWLMQDNKVYCQIGTVNFTKDRWDEIKQSLDNSGYNENSTSGGVQIEAQIEVRPSSPMLIATIRRA